RHPIAPASNMLGSPPPSRTAPRIPLPFWENPATDRPGCVASWPNSLLVLMSHTNAPELSAQVCPRRCAPGSVLEVTRAWQCAPKVGRAAALGPEACSLDVGRRGRRVIGHGGDLSPIRLLMSAANVPGVILSLGSLRRSRSNDIAGKNAAKIPDLPARRKA